MQASNINLEAKDVVKLLGFVFVIASMWYDLKSDLRVFKATTELRLERLENDANKPKPKYKREYSAIIPSQTEVKDDE